MRTGKRSRNESKIWQQNDNLKTNKNDDNRNRKRWSIVIYEDKSGLSDVTEE